MGTWAVPSRGRVISYNYLWKWQQDEGQEEGIKDRPCVIVAAVTTEDGITHVTVFPITTKQPSAPDEGVEIPPKVMKHLRLDADAAWVMITEWNRFPWPGPDLRKTPEGEPDYGFVPNAFLRQVIDRYAERRERGLYPAIVKR